MVTQNDTLAAGDVAADSFGSGYHCAEAVVAAVLEAIGGESGKAIAHATAFGGGFGKSFCEACGALSGALIVIGHIHGRNSPGGDWDLPARLADQLRKHFISEFGTTNCATLRERFGDEQQMTECRKIVKNVTVSLMELLKEHEQG